jgi:hypothetical protein
LTWKKGQSGNPGGRPKAANDVKELARTHSTEAIKRLAHWMRSKDPRASVAAAQALLDRAYGKPPQQVQLDGTLRNCDVSAEPLSDAEWFERYGPQPSRPAN